MSDKTPKNGLFEVFQNILTKHRKPNTQTPVNLDLTNSDGVIVTFPDLQAGDVPKTGDKAEIDGKPVPDGKMILVDGETETVIYFEGGLVVDPPVDEDSEEMEALRAENTQLKADLEAEKLRYSNFYKDVEATMRTLKSEPAPKSTRTVVKPQNVVEEVSDLDERLKTLKDKKGRI